MAFEKDAFKATGTGHTHVDFLALAQGSPPPRWGFLTDDGFKVGGSFSGAIRGIEGKSVTKVGVYGQTGEISTTEGPQFPQNIVAGVFGAAPAVSGTLGWGVVGWSPYNTAVQGFSYANDGVGGLSHQGTGVMGISDLGAGVFGHSGNAAGIVGMTSNPASSAGAFFGDVRVDGNIYANNLKSAAVPFTDGSRRALLHGKSGGLVRGFRQREARAGSRGGKARCELCQSHQARRLSRVRHARGRLPRALYSPQDRK